MNNKKRIRKIQERLEFSDPIAWVMPPTVGVCLTYKKWEMGGLGAGGISLPLSGVREVPTMNDDPDERALIEAILSDKDICVDCARALTAMFREGKPRCVEVIDAEKGIRLFCSRTNWKRVGNRTMCRECDSIRVTFETLSLEETARHLVACQPLYEREESIIRRYPDYKNVYCGDYDRIREARVELMRRCGLLGRQESQQSS